jgi:hypothetical protein
LSVLDLAWVGLMMAVVASLPEEPPLACQPWALEDAERHRQRELLESVRGLAVETRELPDGFAFRLSGGAKTFRDAAEWVSLERRCCPFLAFSLEWKRDDSVWVHVTGAPGVKDIIRAELAMRAR